MNLAAIPHGTQLFIDANLFIYASSGDPTYGAASQALMDRIDRGEIQGYISSVILSDIAHRLMTLEACQTLGIPYTGVARRLKRNPAGVAQLNQFRTAIDDIAAAVRVLDVTAGHVLRAGDLSRQHGLLSGDALVVAVMESHQLQNLASNDSDFDRVPGLARYSPD